MPLTSDINKHQEQSGSASLGSQPLNTVMQVQHDIDFIGGNQSQLSQSATGSQIPSVIRAYLVPDESYYQTQLRHAGFPQENYQQCVSCQPVRAQINQHQHQVSYQTQDNRYRIQQLSFPAITLSCQHQYFPSSQDQLQLNQYYVQNPIIQQNRSTPESKVLTQELSDYIEIVSSVIDTAIRNNAKLPAPKMTKFTTVSAPNISIEMYLKRLASYLDLEVPNFIYLMRYLEIYFHTIKSDRLVDLNSYRLVLTMLLLTQKYIDDDYFNNEYWGKIGGISNRELNDLEVEALSCLNMELFVSENDYFNCKIILANTARSLEGKGSKKYQVFFTADDQLCLQKAIADKKEIPNPFSDSAIEFHNILKSFALPLKVKTVIGNEISSSSSQSFFAKPADMGKGEKEAPSSDKEASSGSDDSIFKDEEPALAQDCRQFETLQEGQLVSPLQRSEHNYRMFQQVAHAVNSMGVEESKTAKQAEQVVKI
ncbi:MAG: cyclin family protein [bacterium]|nr:cyclin family protein [bacterium]